MSVFMNENQRTVRAVVIGVVSSIVIAALLTCLFGMIIQFLPGVPYGIIDYVMIAIEGLSVFIGAYIASAIAKNKGLIIGAVCGGIELVILIAAGMSFSDNDLSILTVIRAAIILICGIIGGIMGVNRKEKVRIK